MNTNLLNNLFNSLKHDDLSFAYTGSFSDQLTVRMIDIARYNIDSYGMGAGLKNKVSFLMGECYQNVVRHGVSTSETLKLHEKSNLLFLRIIGNRFYINSANPVETKSIVNIKAKLDRVNNLSQEELKDLQKQILMTGELNEKGGAGIGIILMARKTGQKLVYHFERVNDDISIFYLQVKFYDHESNGNHKNTDVSLDQIVKLHDNLVKEGLLVMHKGDFSKETFLPVIKMIEGNLKDKFERSFTRTKLYHLTVEILQNISKHGCKKGNVNNGIFTLGCIDDHFLIASANFIDNSEVEMLKERLEKLKKIPKHEFSNFYKEQLRQVIAKNDINIGLGLIDIYRESHEVEYNIEKQGEDSIFSLIAKL